MIASRGIRAIQGVQGHAPRGIGVLALALALPGCLMLHGCGQKGPLKPASEAQAPRTAAPASAPNPQPAASAPTAAHTALPRKP